MNKAFIHHTYHEQMGCGPMELCEQCNPPLGEVPAQAPVAAPMPAPFITKQELIKYMILGTISTTIGILVGEFVIKRWLLKKHFQKEEAENGSAR